MNVFYLPKYFTRFQFDSADSGVHLRGAGLVGVRQPGFAGQAAGFKGGDGVFVAQGQADVVQAAEQAVFAEGLHVEGDLAAVGFDDLLAFQVYGELVAGPGGDFFKKLADLLFGQDDGQQAVFEAVVEKDVGKAGGDEGAKAVLGDGPGGMLAAGAAAEVAARQQHGCAGVTRLVEHEIGVGLAAGGVHARLALVQIAPFVKQVGAEAGALDGFEKLLGDDGVGVHVLAVHGGDDAGVQGEFVHELRLFCG